MNVPKLRFKEFTGEYLEEKVSNVCYISTGKSNTQDKVEDGEYPFYVRSAIIERSNKYLYDEEAVLTVGDGVGTGKTYHYVNGKYDLHQRVYRMFDFKNVLGKYFYYYFTEHFYKRVAKMSAKNSVDSVRLNMIADMPIMLPCVEEQEKVSDFISYVDDKIKVLQKTIISLENQKSALLGKIFSQELRFKDENGKDFPAWEEKKLGEVCDVRDGTHESPKYLKEGYPLVTSKNLIDGKIDFTDINFISKTDYENINKRSKVDAGDILLSMIGTVGSVAFIENDGFAIKNVGLIKKGEKISNKFVYYYLESPLFKQYVKSSNTGGTQKFISLGRIRDASIVLPCKEEQNEIVDFLATIDKKVNLELEKLEHWKQIKKGFLQQMFV